MAMADYAQKLSENLAAINDRIAEAARRGGREPAEIRLVAVTKYVQPEIVLALVAAGCHELGESRPHDLWAKAEALAGQPISWHFVGHLQRNKIRRTLPLVSLLHSVDSERLLHAIDQEMASRGQVLDVLLEVNISAEPAKHGFAPDQLEPLLARFAGLEHVRILGLMGMASLEGGLPAAHRDFAALRALRDRLAK